MFGLFKNKPKWIPGTCNGLVARKHRKKGNVQFILWQAGQQGHKEEFWINMDKFWWDKFMPDSNQPQGGK